MQYWIRLGLSLCLLGGCEPTSGQSSQEIKLREEPPTSTLPENSKEESVTLKPEQKETRDAGLDLASMSVTPSLWTPAADIPTSQQVEKPEPLKPLEWHARGYANAPWSIPKVDELSIFEERPLDKLLKSLDQRYPLSSQLDRAFSWLKTQPQVAKVTWIRDQDTLKIQLKKGDFGYYRPSDARPRHRHH